MAMTRDDVIRMAREAGFTRHSPHSDLMVIHSNGSWIDIEEQLRRFAYLVAKAEREACAKACESYEEHIETFRDSEYQAELAGRQAGAARCAVAIRARGDER